MDGSAKIKIKKLENGIVSDNKYYPDLISLIKEYGIIKDLGKGINYEITIEVKRSN